MTSDPPTRTMSVPGGGSGGRKVTTFDLGAMKSRGEKIVAITAYDALFASLVDAAGVDLILVGDSLASVLCGEESTLAATVEQMTYHGRIVVRGTSRAFVVVDMPFLSYQVSVEEAVRNAGNILKQTGAGAVKLEGGFDVLDAVRAIVRAGVPVMGHLGFTPQSVHALGGHRIQGRDEEAVSRLVEEAAALEEAGVFSIVLELMPTVAARRVTEAISVPTVGIGAGPECDGQVLVLHDMLGLNEGFSPRFLKRYAELGAAVRDAVGRYAGEVREGLYPDASHGYEAGGSDGDGG
ncbi:3-methyl-2-oxobutanoate hydroxymethyltransferase [Candidatus Palauibacter sp.]|uniref:3-methyl-2-oxobutanoate hydroxymethyltransferase n=1 Tax=Candidatus Palauibacter sp. TaxID=3101350 RepID=UPI003AF29222